MKNSIFVVGTDQAKKDVLQWLGDSEFEKADKLEDAKIVVFTGDMPLDPSSYKMKKHTSFMSMRRKDLEEIKLYGKVNPETQIVVGISRGAHLACVMNGGKIIQGCDVSFHSSNNTHPILSPDGWVYDIPSKHTQLMYPYNIEKSQYNVLFYCDPRGDYPESPALKGTGMNGSEMVNNVEAEIVVFKGNPKTPRALAVQGHPEIIPGSPIANRVIQEIKGLI